MIREGQLELLEDQVLASLVCLGNQINLSNILTTCHRTSSKEGKVTIFFQNEGWLTWRLLWGMENYAYHSLVLDGLRTVEIVHNDLKLTWSRCKFPMLDWGSTMRKGSQWLPFHRSELKQSTLKKFCTTWKSTLIVTWPALLAQSTATAKQQSRSTAIQSYVTQVSVKIRLIPNCSIKNPYPSKKGIVNDPNHWNETTNLGFRRTVLLDTHVGLAPESDPGG